MYEKFDAIIFDMDGTLIDSGQLHQHAWTLTLEKYGIPIDPSLMRSLAGVPTIETLAILIEHFSVITSVPLTEMNDYKEGVVLATFKDYVKPTKLAEFALANKNKRPMSVGTGAYTQEAESILSLCGVIDLLDHVVGADQVNNPKPAPDTFLRCAELMGVAPEKCIVFEDAEAGIKAAKDAGMFVVDVLHEMQIENDYFLS